MSSENWFAKKLDGKWEVLVEWDDKSQGNAHYVSLDCLQSASSSGSLCGGSKVVWNGEWRGTIVPVNDPSLEESDSDSDFQTLAQLQHKLVSDAPDDNPSPTYGLSDDSFDDPTHIEPQKSRYSDTDSGSEDSDDSSTRDSSAEPNLASSDTPKRPRIMQERISRASAKHPVRDGACDESCPKKCWQHFAAEDREKINVEFWKMDYNQQRIWIRQTVDNHDKQRKRSVAPKSRRDKTRVYYFKAPTGERHVVCKRFFLTTLGFKPDNNKMIRSAFASGDSQSTPKPDQRGRHAPANKFDHSLIESHVESYNPMLPHYRREHAPNRRYLPSDITITEMHKDFVAKGYEIGLELYRRTLRSMNIGFVLLGGEECELCLLHSNHLKEAPAAHDGSSCEACSVHAIHLERASEARKAYQDDAVLPPDKDSPIVSADLQKVIMLPRLPGVKSCLFTPRIVAFNETFAVLGKSNPSGSANSAAIIWHEATTGRNAEDISSAVWKFLVLNGSSKDFVIWMDNCAAQNKNWTLFTMLITALNCGYLEAQTITLKYLEAGHTFMSADSVHHGVEQSMKKMKKVEDFSDFQQAVSAARKTHVNAVEMAHTDVRSWCDGFSRHKLSKLSPRVYLKDMVSVQFRHGSGMVFFKTAFSQEEYMELDALRKDFAFEKLPARCSSPRGVDPTRKKKILDNLVGFLRPTARLFWNELPTQTE